MSALSRNTKSMGDAMPELLALSVSVAVLGGIWAFIALGPLGGFALVWIGFIAAGCFFAAGGDTKALSKTIVGMIYGAIVAWIALLIIAKVPVPGLGTVWPAIVVGVTVFFLVIVASTDLLSCVPANVYGYAALVGYTLSAGKLDALTAADNSNPLFLVVVSAILGAVLGYLMGQLAGVLKSRPGRTDTPGAKQHLIRRLADHCSRELVLGYGGDAVVSHASQSGALLVPTARVAWSGLLLRGAHSLL